MSVFDVLFRMGATGGDAVKGETDKARKSFGRLRVEADKTGKAAQALGGRFGELHGRAEALTGAFGAGALKYAAAGAGLVAVGVAAKAAATAVFDVSAAIVDINRNASEMLDKLTATEKRLLKGLEVGALNAEKELEALDRTLLALQLRIGAEFAPAVSKGSVALRGLTDVLLMLTPGGALGALPDTLMNIGGAIGGPFLKNLRAAASVAGLLVNAMAYLAGPVSKTIDSGNVAGAITPTGAGMLAFTPDKPRSRRGTPAAEGTPPAADPFAGTVFGEEDFLPFWLDEANKPKYDEAIAATLRLGEAQHKFSMELEKSGELAEQQVLTAGLALPALGDLAMSVGDMISESIINAGQGSKKAMREAAAVSKAFGIMDVGIKTSQAIMAALTIPPPAGPILAGLAGATGGIQAAVVASTPLPTFHVGGVQRFGGDDEGVVSKRVRAGEFDTTFTPEGFRAAGGAEGIARMNSGQMAGGGDTYLVMPDGIFGPVRGMAKPDPSFGQRRR